MGRKRHILAELAAMSREDVEAELEQVREEKAGLEMEEALLGQMLRIHQFAQTGIAGSGDVIEQLAEAAPQQIEQNLSANVLSPSDLRELLADRGVYADLSAIRLALRRWAERNQIMKEGHVYRAFAADSLRRHAG